MKTIIYYFTGTGNSLAAARKIAAGTGDCELIPIAMSVKNSGHIIPQAERVGIVCPVYFAGLPVMVAEWAGRLDLSKTLYTFAVVTYGGSGASPALVQLDTVLRKQHDRGLDAGFTVKMPGNYILMYSAPSGKKQEDILSAAEREITEIATVVSRCGKAELPSSFLGNLIHTLMYNRFASHVHDDDRKFSVTDACTTCGTCAAVCPAGNIVITGGRPAWQHRCELCCGCIHACPVQAIQAGHGTEKRLRYRNPSVTVDELKQPGAGKP